MLAWLERAPWPSLRQPTNAGAHQPHGRDSDKRPVSTRYWYNIGNILHKAGLIVAQGNSSDRQAADDDGCSMQSPRI